MILCFFLKLLTEISLYFVLANCIMSVAFTGIDSLIPAILCAAAGTVAYWLDEKKKNRYLSVPLLLLAFLFAKGIGTGIALFIPAFYIYMVIKEKHFFLDSEQQTLLFRWGLVASFICFFLFGTFIGLRFVVPFILLFLFINVFLMRLLRQNPAVLHNKRFLLSNALQLGSTLLVAAIVTNKVVINFLSRCWSWVYDTFFEPLSIYIAMAMAYLGTLMDSAFKLVFDDYHRKPQHYKWSPGAWHDEAFYEQIEQSMNQESPAVIFLQICLFIIGLLVVLAIIRWRRRGSSFTRQTAVKETRRSIVNEKKKEDTAPIDLLPPREPRAAVRYYYRRFLQLCKKLDYKFPPSFTTQMIAHRVTRRFGKDEVQSIRRTYIRARYSDEEVTAQDVAAIKEQVNKLRERHEPKNND